jgi:aminopeptidase N/puromycin-sensitive aminopeptidase
MKATFALTVIADEADRVISNSSVVADTPGPEAGKHTVRFATTPRMSSYLVALVVGDFDCIRGSSEGVPHGVCGTPDRIADGKLALRMSQDFLKYYNNYFGAPYPFGKLDHIGIPDFSAGAMENSGAIIYRDIYLLKDDRTISPESEKSLAGIISHEIAHMWFGDLVTMKWWNDLWLNEGFADWIAPKPIRVMHPEWNFEVDAVEEIIGPMRADSLQNTRPIQVDVHSAEQADELFDSITYGKASAVLGMVEAYIGEENFQKGVSRYIQNHAFSNATADDFATALARETEVPVDDVLDSFVKQPGVPVIHVESTCVNGKTILKTRQKRFFLDPRLANRESDEVWEIPLCMRAADSDKTTCKIFGDRKTTFRIDGCGSPTVLNARGKGYYIVASEIDDLRALTRDRTGLSEAEKVALVRDEWFLVRAAHRPIKEYLDLSAAILEKERSRGPIVAVLENLSTVGRWLPPAQRSSFRTWLQAELRPLLEEMGWKPTPDESADRKSLRAAVLKSLALDARDPEVLAEARKQAREYLANPSAIDTSVLPSLLAAAAVEADDQLFEQVLSALSSTKSTDVRQRLVAMLGGSRDPRQMRRVLDRAVQADMRATESRSLVSSVLGSLEGRDLAWEYVKTRWPEVEKSTRGRTYAGLIRAAGTSFCDATTREDVKRFFTEHPIEASERAMAQALESIDLCVQTTRIQAPRLASWLQQHTRSAGGM